MIYFYHYFKKKTLNKKYNYFILKYYFEKYRKEDNKQLLKLVGEKILEIKNNDYEILYELAESYRKDNLTLSNKYYKESIKYCPKNSKIILNYIKQYYSHNIENMIKENLKYNKDNKEYLYHYFLKHSEKKLMNHFNNKQYGEALEYINSIGTRKSKLYRIETIKNYCIKNNLFYKVVEEETEREIYKPHYFGYDRDSKTEKFLSPEIYISELYNVKVVGENSCIISEDICLYDMAKNDEEERYDLRFGAIQAIDRNYTIIESIESKEEFDFVISLIGFAPYNYYHFTVELLSRLQYIDRFEEYRTVPLLIDKAVKNIPQYYELLNMINKYNHPIMFLDKDLSYQIKKLLYVSYNTWMPIGIKEGSELRFKDSLISESAIKYIRNMIIENNNKNGFRKIFISRKNTVNSRLLNEEDVIELFKIYGFQTIYPEQMTLNEQVKIFSEAEFVAGVTGAAFTNIIYCPKNAKIMCIIPKKFNFNVYSTIAKSIDLKTLFIDAEPIILEKQISSSRYILDINYCNSVLRSMFQEKENIYIIDELLKDIKNEAYKKYSIINQEIVNYVFYNLDKLKTVDFYNDVDKYFYALNLIKNTVDNLEIILAIENKIEQYFLINLLSNYLRKGIEFKMDY